MARNIVVFGATGYTGELVSRELVALGARPLLAARSAERLEILSSQLGGLPTRVADVSKPASIRALIERGDVLISTVGPFARFGHPAVEAAIAAGATYLDSTGEPAFIREIFERYHRSAHAARVALLTAFGFDWVPGNLAGALALQEAGQGATRVDLGYFAMGGGGISGGTRASMVGAVLEPSFALRAGRVVAERGTARARAFEIAPGKSRMGATVGGSEHFGLVAVHPTLREAHVYLGMADAQRLPVVSAVLAAVTRIPGVRASLKAVAARYVKGSTGGPDEAARAKGTSVIVAEAFGAGSSPMTRVKLQGVNGYTFTGRILAWAAIEALEKGVSGTGALGPVAAFGLDRLQAGVAQAGLERVA